MATHDGLFSHLTLGTCPLMNVIYFDIKLDEDWDEMFW
jgi:hypothetical protein